MILIYRLNTEVTQLRLAKTTLTNEVEEYRTLAERRRDDIEALNVDCKTLTKQLAEANAAKCEALVRSEDIAAKEIALKHKESRIEQVEIIHLYSAQMRFLGPTSAPLRSG